MVAVGERERERQKKKWVFKDDVVIDLVINISAKLRLVTDTKTFSNGASPS